MAVEAGLCCALERSKCAAGGVHTPLGFTFQAHGCKASQRPWVHTGGSPERRWDEALRGATRPWRHLPCARKALSDRHWRPEASEAPIPTVWSGLRAFSAVNSSGTAPEPSCPGEKMIFG